MGGDITTITNEVLAERIANFRTDLHADLGRIELQLSKLVPREVYELQRTEFDRRVTVLETQAKADADQRRQMYRWLIAAVAIPVLTIIVQIVLSTRGVTP